MTSTQRQPIYFVSHGGGPWPWMPEQAAMYAPLTQALQSIPAQLPQSPAAILMVSAHWITQGAVQVTSAANPGMLYDYYGFPAPTYQIHYRAPGSPELAGRVTTLLQGQGVAVTADSQRGYDHGAFVPAYVMVPQATIPMVQLSIEAGFDPDFHHALGLALQPLRDENILIVGSGLSYHNLRRFGPAGREPSAQFDAWLQDALIDRDLNARQETLRRWSQAPSARIAHPMEDHLVPLFVASGAAGEDKATCFHHEVDAFGSLTVSSFRFG
ncbi:MAG TPA: class III extradiol ring-cleavage dioxygenase [Castellaniella sp.]|uniref:DODA-type extradiol aromatic ring-opening family dioxygenase n=1 Tax=Castellaniella sp. TaxID=1955812 RepID=UPI002EFC9144